MFKHKKMILSAAVLLIMQASACTAVQTYDNSLPSDNSQTGSSVTEAVPDDTIHINSSSYPDNLSSVEDPEYTDSSFFVSDISETENHTSLPDETSHQHSVSDTVPSRSSVTASSYTSDGNSSVSSDTEVSVQSYEPIRPYVDQQTSGMINKILSAGLKSSEANITNISQLYQYPELPTGCESVSLTMVLNSYGYRLPKTEIADHYLIFGDTMITSYLGDPRTDEGAGIYPPGLMFTVKNFIEKNNARIGAADTTGTQLYDLYKIVAEGYPVLVWSTSYLRYPYVDGVGYTENWNGRDYKWYTNEHCVVLSGYSIPNHTVTVYDPISGKMVYDADSFRSVYDAAGQMSMVVIPK